MGKEKDDLDENELEDRDEDEDEDGKAEGVDPDADEDSDKKPDTKKEKDDDVEIIKTDDRIATGEKKSRENESVEEKRERRRLEKKQKRERRLAAERRDKQLILQLRRENQDLKKGQNDINAKIDQGMQRIASQDELQIDNAITQQAAVYNSALAQFNKAITEGNGPAAAEAQRYMDDAKTKHTKLIDLKGNFVAEKQKTVTRPTETRANDSKKRLFLNRFITKHDWYDPDKGDDESKRAHEIDMEITGEGYDPNTKEYWDELEYRLKEEGIGSYAEEKPAQRSNAKENGSPRPRQTMGGEGGDGYSPGTGTKLRIPEHVVQMAKDAGQWDDLKKREMFKRNWKEQNGAA